MEDLAREINESIKDSEVYKKYLLCKDNIDNNQELCVLKKHALPLLLDIDKEHPFFVEANNLVKFLKYYKDIDDELVPCNSLLREFIGGSCFQDV